MQDRQVSLFPDRQSCFIYSRPMHNPHTKQKFPGYLYVSYSGCMPASDKDCLDVPLRLETQGLLKWLVVIGVRAIFFNTSIILNCRKSGPAKIEPAGPAPMSMKQYWQCPLLLQYHNLCDSPTIIIL